MARNFRDINYISDWNCNRITKEGGYNNKTNAIAHKEDIKWHKEYFQRNR